MCCTRSASPGRPALNLQQASWIMAGRPLDRDAVRVVLDAAAAPPAALPPLPGDLAVSIKWVDVCRRCR
jgi:hypothetical protein